jgi:hypothetical protein
MRSFSFRVGSYCSSLHFLDTLFCTHTHKRDGRVHQKKLKRGNNHQKTVFSHSFKSRRHSLDRKVGPEHCTLLAFWAFFFSCHLLHLRVLGDFSRDAGADAQDSGHSLFVV